MTPFIAEFLGTAIVITLGNGVVANNLLSQSKGITRIFGDYSLKDNSKTDIEEVGNTTIIPNSVIVEIKKI